MDPLQSKSFEKGKRVGRGAGQNRTVSEVVDPSFLTLETEESKKVIKLMLSEKLQISGKVREGRGRGKKKKKERGIVEGSPQHRISEFFLG